MSCELNPQKRSHDEIVSTSKHQRLDTSFCDRNPNISMAELNLQNLRSSKIVDSVEDSYKTTFHDSTPTIDMEPSSNMFSINNLSDTETTIPAITMNHSTNMFDTSDDYSNDFASAKDFLNNFFNTFDFEKLEFTDFTIPLNKLTSHDKAMQEPASSLTSEEFRNITSPITPMNESSDIIPCKKSDMISNSRIFQKDLGDLIFLTLKFSKRQYSIHIREIKCNVFSGEEIATDKRIDMDINSWYEFQYKIFAFNLKYKSSSFIANNTILVLNDKSLMSINNLINNSHINLNDYQLENLKEMAYDLNKKLIYHMYTKQLPYLIKCNGTLSNVSQESELMLMTNFILTVEENVLSILNQIYECFACIQNQPSRSLHSCFWYNNREKFQQLGDMLLMLVDLDFVTSTFLNRVDCISENFL